MRIPITALMVLLFCTMAEGRHRRQITTEVNAEESSTVVHGKIKSVRARRTRTVNGDDIILSRVTVKVQESLKGDAGDEIYVEVPGGTINKGTKDELTMKVSHQTPIDLNEEVVLYLDKDDTFKDAHKLKFGKESFVRVDQTTRRAGDKSLEEIRTLARRHRGGNR